MTAKVIWMMDYIDSVLTKNRHLISVSVGLLAVAAGIGMLFLLAGSTPQEARAMFPVPFLTTR